MGSLDKELLFYDTFAHDAAETLHVDLVRFPMPVMLREIRVVPRDVRGQPDLLDRIGLTSPASFTLDVFSNDSTNPLAPTFDMLGTIEFQGDPAVLSHRPKLASDLIVVRGYYTALTLCLYGNIAPPPPGLDQMRFGISRSPRSSHRSRSPFSDAGSEYSDDGRAATRPDGTMDRATSGRGEGEAGEGGGKRMDSYDDLFEPFSPVNSPDRFFDLSDDDLGAAKRSAVTPGGFEEFSDEEIAFGDDEFDSQDSGQGLDYLYDVTWMESGVGFNPYQSEIKQLESFATQLETPHETLMAKTPKADAGSKRSVSDEASKLRDVVLKPRESQGTVKWVEQIEEIPSYLYPGLALLLKKSSAEGKDVLQKLVNWTKQSLNLEATGQLPIAVNIRQLKAGLRLVPSIAALGRKYAHMLVKHGLLGELCQLVRTEHMATSMQLLCLRAVDSLLEYPQGMECFLGLSKKKPRPGKQTPYQLTLRIILSNPTVRVAMASSVLLKKVHVYEVLVHLQEAVDKVVQLTPVKPSSTQLPDDFWNVAMETEEEEEGGSGAEGEDEFGITEAMEVAGPVAPTTEETTTADNTRDQSDEAMQEEGAEPDAEAPDNSVPVNVPEDVISEIVSCLNELRTCLEQPHQVYTLPPLKAFPTNIKGMAGSGEDSWLTFVRMFRARRLLECLLVLVTAPSTALNLAVFAGVRAVLLQLISTQQGLLFLCSNPPVVNAIARSLTQDNELPLSAMQPLTDLLTADSADSCSAQNLSLLMIYHIQVLQSLDVLRRCSRASMTDLESPEPLSALHILYSLTLVPIGKSAVAHVLSIGENMAALLPFVEPRKQREHDLRLAKSSVSSRYAAVLILQLLQSGVRADFLVSLGSKLLTVADFFKDNPSPTMSDLHNWVHPVRALSNPSKTIPSLISLIREHLPQLSCSRPGKGNAPIITALRLLLCHITPPDTTKDTQGDLKYLQGVIACFSANAIDTLLALFQKLSDIIQPVWSQRHTLSLSTANSLVLLSSLSLRVVLAMLTKLLSQGNHQYRDMRLVPALLSVHVVFCSSSHSSVLSNAAPEIQSLIIDTLAVYTRPEPPIKEEGKQDLSSSCWFLMLQELFKHVLSAPKFFLSSLMILSELLPLPLPIHSTRPFSPTDAATVQAQRQLWSCHLVLFSPKLMDVLDTLLPSSCLAVQQALRRLCAQLADLHPDLSLLAARLVIKAIIREVEKQLETPEVKEGAGEGEKKALNSCLLRLLTTCSVLCQQAMFKTAVLDLISREETNDTKSFSRFIPLLLFLVQKKETNVSAKLCVTTILNSLCNVFISLSVPEAETGLTEQHLSNSLPSRSQFEHIASAVVGLVTSAEQPLATIAQGLKALLSFCQHNFGLLFIFSFLPSKVAGFAQLFRRMKDAARSASPPSPDTLSCISLFLDLIRLLLSATVTARLQQDSESPSDEDFREFYFPVPLLRGMLGKKEEEEGEGEVGKEEEGEGEEEGKEEEEEEEGLSELREALQESCKEDERLLEEFSAPIAELVTAFGDAKSRTTDLPTLERPLWPAMQSVGLQFEVRDTIVASDNAVGVSDPEYWLATPPHDETELESDVVAMNLSEFAQASCDGLNLKDELKKHLLPSPPPSPSKQIESRKRKIPLSGPEAQKRLKEAMELRIANSRGKKDFFRIRKMNTSRPPSMHVDDFNAFRPGMGRGGRAGSSVGLPYLPPHPTGPFLQPLGGGRWLGGVAPGMGGYQRRDLPSVMRPWDRLSQPFLHSAQMKQHSSSVALRSATMWSQFTDPYAGRHSRGALPSRANLPWLGSSRQVVSGGGVAGAGSGGRLSGRHGPYKRSL